MANADPTEFENVFADSVNFMIQLMHTMKFTQYDVKIKTVLIRKYVRSKDPLNELYPIKGWEDLTSDSLLFFSLNITCDGVAHSYFGNFYKNNQGRLEPYHMDDDETEIVPEQVKNGEILPKVIEELKTHWDKVLSVIVLAINVALARK
jgi:hypothetical protein